MACQLAGRSVSSTLQMRSKNRAMSESVFTLLTLNLSDLQHSMNNYFPSFSTRESLSNGWSHDMKPDLV